MTALYANQKPVLPDVTSIDGPLQVLKWSHSVLEEPNFVNEWSAVEMGRCLAFELGNYDGVHSETCSLKQLPSRSSTRKVGFSEVVDVLIGMEDCLDMYQRTISEICCGKGLFPWSSGLLRGGLFLDDLPAQQAGCSVQQPVNPLFPLAGSHPNFASYTWNGKLYSNSNENDEDVLPSTSSIPRPTAIGGYGSSTGPSLPMWGAGIQSLLQQEGVVDTDDDGKVIFVTSYYLDHLRHPIQEDPRPLRFDEDALDWEAGIRLVWEDLVDPGLPLEVVIVRPDPPQFACQGTVATVIVHQQARPDRAACLISAIHVMDLYRRCAFS